MFTIQTYNKIAAVGLNRLGDNYTIDENAANADGIILRSQKLHDTQFADSVKGIARAGAGTNNVPVDRCSEEGIVVFNTPGANANGVKELVIAGLLLGSRKVYQGIEWAKSLTGKEDDIGKAVEKGKSNFKGPEIKGKTLGIIGLGAIGVLVANAASALGMNVIGHDPYMSVSSAWKLSRNVKQAADLNSLMAESDYISLHVPLMDATKGMVNKETFGIMKDGVRIVNFSRGGLVNDADLKEALASGKVAAYVTDFPNNELAGVEGVVPIPHLGASTPESEDNCAIMAADQMKDFLENGNIVNSVNFPEAVLARSAGTGRLTMAHKNVPNMVGQISGVLADAGINIDDMLNKSRGDVAYTIIDVHGGSIAADVVTKIQGIEGMLKVRTI